MRDGKTRKRPAAVEAPRLQDFLDRQLAIEVRELEPDAYELKS